MREVLKVERTGCQDGQTSKCLQEMGGECEGIAWVTARAETSSLQRKNAYLSNTLLSQEDKLELLELYARKGYNEEGKEGSAQGTGREGHERVGPGFRRGGEDDVPGCWTSSPVGKSPGRSATWLAGVRAWTWLRVDGLSVQEEEGCRRLAALTAASETPGKPHLGIVTEIPDRPHRPSLVPAEPIISCTLHVPALDAAPQERTRLGLSRTLQARKGRRARPRRQPGGRRRRRSRGGQGPSSTSFPFNLIPLTPTLEIDTRLTKLRRDSL